MKPICVTCKRFYRPSKTGVYFLENMPIVNGAAPGDAEPEKWKPYKLWSGDEWKCPNCKSTIIVGTGLVPIAFHHEPNFLDKVERFGADKL